MPSVAGPNPNPERYSPFWFRFFEIVPGASVWFFLTMPFFLSFSYPLLVTAFILVFDTYWLVTTVNYTYILIRGYYRLRRNLNIDWQEQLDATLEILPKNTGFIDWNDLYHAVIFATFKEEQGILEASIDSIIAARYDNKKVIVVLATEERDHDNASRIAASLSAKYDGIFHRFIITEHPDGIEGEVKAKGANVAWAGKELTRQMLGEGISLDKVIVSTADADARFSTSYFLCLSYHYVILPNRIRCCFQPITMYFNNLWQTPLFSRVLAFGSTFWQMNESVRDYRLVTFATHSMSLQTLVEIDYWCTNIVNEDSRQFFRAYFHYDGDFQVVPTYMPIYMDAVHTGSYWQTALNLYRQQQRWAYGVEHFPYIVLESLRRHKIPAMNRFMLVWRAFFGSFFWATAPFLITAVGWIPIIVNHGFRNEVAVANFGHVTGTILSFTWVGLIASATVTVAILPPLPKGKSYLLIISMFAQWIILPISGILFSALPGLDAQTRLMLGKYLGFRVTPKLLTPSVPSIDIPHERVA
jgi:hypothetical protein